MVDLLGYHGSDDGDFIGDRADFGQNGGDMLARFTEMFEFMLRPKDFQVVPLPLKLCNGLSLGKGLWHWLAVHFCQFGLVV